MRKEFASFELNTEDLNTVAYIRDKFESLLDSLDANLVEADGRCKSIMVTHLETACMYAVKSVSATRPVKR